jgi:Tol biopolymer transport system component
VLHQVPVLGGASRKLVEDVDSPVTFSPDGQRLAFVREYSDQHESALMVVNVDGTGERRLATRKEPAHFRMEGPAWSPDGKCIAVGLEGEVVAVQVADGKEKTLSSKLGGSVGRVVWLADGSGLLLIAFDDAGRWQIWQVAYPSGQAHRITNDTNHYQDLSLTADSKAIVAVSGSQVTRIWVSPEGKPDRPRQINPGTGKWDGRLGFSWTPEGKIVYTSSWECCGPANLWVMDADGSNPKQLTVAGDVGRGTSVCRDGRYIVFSRGLIIWRMDIDGGNPKQLMSESNALAYYPRCSHDGKWVVYEFVPSALFQSGTRTIWKIPIDGGTAAQITEKPCRWPAISLDGNWIACVLSEDSGKQQKIAVLPFQGGPPTKTFDMPFSRVGSLDWTHDGKSVTFVARNKGSEDIWIQSLVGGAPRRVTEILAPTIGEHAWSPDGKQLALEYGSSTADAVLISNFK